MQLTINVPDTLPKARVAQRIRELEQSLQDEASFMASVLPTKQAKQEKLAVLIRIAQECAALPTLDNRSADEILGYSNSTEGLWGNE